MSAPLDGAPQYIYNNIQCITAGKIEDSEECFAHNDNTHFMSDT